MWCGPGFRAQVRLRRGREVRPAKVQGSIPRSVDFRHAYSWPSQDRSIKAWLLSLWIHRVTWVPISPRCVMLCFTACRNGLYERPWGAAGIWGKLVRQWLQDLLPHDAAQRCHQRVRLPPSYHPLNEASEAMAQWGRVLLFAANRVELRARCASYSPASPVSVSPTLFSLSLLLCAGSQVHVLVTSTTWNNGLLEHRWVSNFSSNQELLDVLLASIHIPYFMDTRQGTLPYLLTTSSH